MHTWMGYTRDGEWLQQWMVYSVSIPVNFQSILLCFEVTNWVMFGIEKILQVSSNKLCFWCCNGRFTFETTNFKKVKLIFGHPVLPKCPDFILNLLYSRLYFRSIPILLKVWQAELNLTITEKESIIRWDY